MGTLHPLSAHYQAPSIGPAWPGLCRAPQPTGCTPGPRIPRGRKTAAGNLKILLLGGTGAGSPPGPQPRPPASPASSARMPPGVCAAPAQRPEHPGLLRPLSGSCCPGSRGSHCQQVTALRGAGAAGQRGAVRVLRERGCRLPQPSRPGSRASPAGGRVPEHHPVPSPRAALHPPHGFVTVTTTVATPREPECTRKQQAFGIGRFPSFSATEVSPSPRPCPQPGHPWCRWGN